MALSILVINMFIIVMEKQKHIVHTYFGAAQMHLTGGKVIMTITCSGGRAEKG